MEPLTVTFALAAPIVKGLAAGIYERHGGVIRDKVTKQVAGLRQISSPNKAQSSFVSKEYVPIVVQPLYEAERHRCAKRL
ncbi:MAG: hypothetical protein AB1861_09035 [Cyanobacteriota bacterium]